MLRMRVISHCLSRNVLFCFFSIFDRCCDVIYLEGWLTKDYTVICCLTAYSRMLSHMPNWRIRRQKINTSVHQSSIYILPCLNSQEWAEFLRCTASYRRVPADPSRLLFLRWQ